MANLFVVILVSIVLGAQLPTSYSQVPNIWTPEVSACIVSTLALTKDGKYSFEDCKTLCQRDPGCKSVIYYSNTMKCQHTEYSLYEIASPCPFDSNAIFTELVARINCPFHKFDEKQKQCCDYCISVGCEHSRFECANSCEWQTHRSLTDIIYLCQDDLTCCPGRGAGQCKTGYTCDLTTCKCVPIPCCGHGGCTTNQKCSNGKCISSNIPAPQTCCRFPLCNANQKCFNCKCVPACNANQKCSNGRCSVNNRGHPLQVNIQAPQTCCTGQQCNPGFRCSNVCQCVWNGGK